MVFSVSFWTGPERILDIKPLYLSKTDLSDKSDDSAILDSL